MNKNHELIRFNSDEHFMWHEVFMRAHSDTDWLKAHAQEYHNLFHGGEPLNWRETDDGIEAQAPSGEKSYPFINYQISESQS